MSTGAARIATAFTASRHDGRAALVTFIMGGDPDVDRFRALLNDLPAAGADVIEIGMPFSDPMADGPIIQAAGRRALREGTTLRDIFFSVKAFRQENQHTPIILMGYYNPVYRYGVEKFCTHAVEAGVDGMILVDLPPEEEREFKPQAAAAGLALTRLVAPTSLDTRLPMLMHAAEGFVYYISVTGITGAARAEAGQLREDVEHLRRHTNLPIAVGFGIKTPYQAREVADCGVDGVVVGSALVEKIARGEDALGFVQALAAALK